MDHRVLYTLKAQINGNLPHSSVGRTRKMKTGTAVLQPDMVKSNGVNNKIEFEMGLITVPWKSLSSCIRQ